MVTREMSSKNRSVEHVACIHNAEIKISLQALPLSPPPGLGKALTACDLAKKLTAAQRKLCRLKGLDKTQKGHMMMEETLKNTLGDVSEYSGQSDLSALWCPGPKNRFLFHRIPQ